MMHGAYNVKQYYGPNSNNNAINIPPNNRIYPVYTQTPFSNKQRKFPDTRRCKSTQGTVYRFATTASCHFAAYDGKQCRKAIKKRFNTQMSNQNPSLGDMFYTPSEVFCTLSYFGSVTFTPEIPTTGSEPKLRIG